MHDSPDHSLFPTLFLCTLTEKTLTSDILCLLSIMLWLNVTINMDGLRPQYLVSMTKKFSNFRNLTTMLSNLLQHCFHIYPLNNIPLIAYLLPKDKNIFKGIKNKYILHENVYMQINVRYTNIHKEFI